MENQEKSSKSPEALDAARVKSIDRACAAAVALLKQIPAKPPAGKPHKRRNKRSR